MQEVNPNSYRPFATAAKRDCLTRNCGTETSLSREVNAVSCVVPSVYTIFEKKSIILMLKAPMFFPFFLRHFVFNFIFYDNNPKLQIFVIFYFLHSCSCSFFIFEEDLRDLFKEPTNNEFFMDIVFFEPQISSDSYFPQTIEFNEYCPIFSINQHENGSYSPAFEKTSEPTTCTDSFFHIKNVW